MQPVLWALQTGRCGKPGEVQIIPAVPRQLANRLAAREFDAAIVPVFEYFRHPGLYTYVPGPVIGARGAVLSVALFASAPIETLHTVYLDASSLTSVHLFKVLAAEMGLRINYRDTAEHPVPRPLPPGEGWVVIGDPAIAELNRHPYFLDLGVAWEKLTGLPFVFAAWLVPNGVNQPRLTPLLQESMDIGAAHLPEVARQSARQFNVTPDFALKYFRENLYYHLGEKELAGWQEFGRLLYKHGLIEQPTPLRAYAAQ